MLNLIRFWRKDIVNKLIVLVVLVIVVIVGIQIYFLVFTPAGKTLVARFSPTQTLSVQDLFKHGGETTTAEAVQTLKAVIPTITTMPFTPMANLQKASVTATNTPKAPGASLTPGPSPLPTTAPGTPTIVPSITPTRLPTSLGGTCLVKTSPQTGKVVDVIDGNTIRVLLGDLVYVVRYIGVEVPEDATFAQVSSATNGQMVFAKEVKLYADGADKDAANRLLRYVVVGNATLVNQALIRAGLATALNAAYSCTGDFAGAEQDARSAHAGMWKSSQP
jgi:endonuclease YncB( thermonuclease family)